MTEAPEDGNCFNCSEWVSSGSYCYGCSEFICGDCDVSGAWGSHEPDDHLNEDLDADDFMPLANPEDEAW